MIQAIKKFQLDSGCHWTANDSICVVTIAQLCFHTKYDNDNDDVKN